MLRFSVGSGQWIVDITSQGHYDKTKTLPPTLFLWDFLFYAPLSVRKLWSACSINSEMSPIQIFLDGPSGLESHVVGSDTKVGIIRRKIAADDFRLAYDGRDLIHNNRTLDDEGISNGSTIRVLPRLRGGAIVNIRVKTSFGRCP